MLTLTTTAQGDPPAWVMILGGVVVVVMFGVITYRKRMRESGGPLGPLAIFRASPLVFRVVAVVFLVGMGLWVYAVTTESQERWMYAVLPGACAVQGLLLVFNIAGSATKPAAAARRQSFAGGLEHSLTAKPSYARAFGAVCVLIGGVMLYVVSTQPL